MPLGCKPNVDCWTGRAGGSATTALLPGAIFVSTNGADGQVATLADDDWHLATKDAAITAGGKDASSTGYCSEPFVRYPRF